MHYYFHRSSRVPNGWDVREDTLAGDSGSPLDTFRTRSGAEHATVVLNSGAATVDPHAVLGCRIISRELIAA